MNKKLTIPDDWNSDFLGKLASISTGSKNTQDKVDDGKYPFFVRSQTVERINTYSFDGEAILTAGDGVGTGKVFHYINGKFDFHQRVYKISDFKEQLFPGYFFEYFRRNFIRQVVKYTAKTSVDSVRMEMLTQMEIPLPPLEEQKKIAQILSTWDDSIEAVDELIEKNEKKLKALLHYYFGNVDKDSKTKIGSICTVRRGASPRPIKDPKWFGGDTGWVRISDVTSSKKYLRHTQDYLSDEGVNKSVFIEKGEVVLSICATIGRPIIVDMKACIHDGFVWFDGLPDNLDREFFYYQLSFMEEKYKSLRQHGSQGNLNTSIVSNTRLYLPDPKIQKEIAKNLSLLDEQLDLLNKKKHLLEKQKKGLMQRLLTGKVRVN